MMGDSDCILERKKKHNQSKFRLFTQFQMTFRLLHMTLKKQIFFNWSFLRPTTGYNEKHVVSTIQYVIQIVYKNKSMLRRKIHQKFQNVKKKTPNHKQLQLYIIVNYNLKLRIFRIDLNLYQENGIKKSKLF